MKITMRSPAAGLAAGETGDVEYGYATWLVANGYATAVEEPKPKPAPRRPRHATRDEPTEANTVESSTTP